MVTTRQESHLPFYEQVILGIKEDILLGILMPGDRVPSVREMAKHLLMNPNTISKAYKILEEQNVLVTVVGKGTFVGSIEKIRNEERIIKWKHELQILLIEAKHLQLSDQEIHETWQILKDKLEGETNEITTRIKEN